jgi:hypothetical protein
LWGVILEPLCISPCFVPASANVILPLTLFRAAETG